MLPGIFLYATFEALQHETPAPNTWRAPQSFITAVLRLLLAKKPEARYERGIGAAQLTDA